MSEMLEKFGMGWLPDYPDFRDYTINHDKVSPRLLKLGQKATVKKMLAKLALRTRQKSAYRDP